MFLPQLRVLRDAIFECVLRAFADLESEANRIEQDAYERFMAHSNEYTDPGDLAEAALRGGP